MPFKTRANSPCEHYLFDLPLDDFEEVDIQENATMGCGFIPIHLLQKILGYGFKGENTIAIQVRVLSSHLGLFKGMLVAKEGITKIQLNKSMKKVEASPFSSKHHHRSNKKILSKNTVLLLIKNVFPSSISENLERYFNSNHKSKPKKMDEYKLQRYFEHVLRL